MEIVVLLALVSVFVLVGYAIGKAKGQEAARATLSCLLGCLLGPIGWIITAVLPATATGTRICPYCRERVHRDAVICPHCHWQFWRGSRAP